MAIAAGRRRAAASARASREPSRASASGPTSTGWPASSGSTAGCSTTAAACSSRSRPTPPPSSASSARLPPESPPLARVERVTQSTWRRPASPGFAIRASPRGGEPRAGVSPDSATCADCLRELFDPADRRHRYPFINCTNCGPRFTIVRGVPYDRPLTTMAGFRMCARLPGGVRGPGRPPLPRPAERLPGLRPVAGAARSRRLAGAARGRDALDLAIAGAASPARSWPSRASAATTSPAAPTTRTRSRRCAARKHREDEAVRADGARISPRRARSPMSTPRRRGAAVVTGAPDRARAAARRRAASPPRSRPASRELGVMLPYSPLHHLLHAGCGVPLVLTSGNRLRRADRLPRRGRARTARRRSPTCSWSTTGRSRRAPTTRSRGPSSSAAGGDADAAPLARLRAGGAAAAGSRAARRCSPAAPS